MDGKPLFQADSAIVEGDVRFGSGVSLWHHAIVRTEEEPIIIGEDVNIQDGCILHTDHGFPITVGNRVTIGHRAIIHGAVIEDDCLIGMGAIVMNGARIKKGSVVAAGALVAEGKQIGPEALVAGVPARELRKTTPADRQNILENADHYLKLAGERLKTA